MSVTFDGASAPLVYVSGSQIAGIVPYAVASRGSTQVSVQYNGQSSAPLAVPVVPALPGLFSANFSGTGAAVAFNQDGTLNSETNPAAKGSVVVLYGTGEGQTNPAGLDGSIVQPGALTVPAAGCSASVGGLASTVLYCGSVPFVGRRELQVNLQLAPQIGSGRQPVVVRIGTAQSQGNLTIFVQ